MSESVRSANIYFMTGTGNSYWSATEIAGMASASGYTSNVIPSDSLLRNEIKKPAPDDLVVFSYPTHGFITPWHMLKLFLKFPRGRSRVILVNNRAGLKIGKLFTPGLSGLAVLLPGFLLLLKGYSIASVVPLDTPSNWISIHPGVRQRVSESIFERRSHDLERMWERVGEGRTWFPRKFFIGLPLDLFVSPVSIGYLLFGRFMLGRTYFPDPSCDGCGICADRCPVSAIKMVKGKPWWTYRCESCMRCANVCPRVAVNSSVPLMVIYTLIVIRLVNGRYGVLLGDLAAEALHIPGKIMHYLLLWVVTIIATWLIYSALFWLSRFRPVSHLLAMSTPMRYWRRYLAPGFRGLYKRKQS